MKRSSGSWLAHFGIPASAIINPDGWDRKDFFQSFNEHITIDEFESRLRASTLQFTPAVKQFLTRNEP